jgi:hypothetical protein
VVDCRGGGDGHEGKGNAGREGPRQSTHGHIL